MYNQEERQLFGGNIVCCVPRSFDHWSEGDRNSFPDNQEYFRNQEGATIIFDLLEWLGVDGPDENSGQENHRERLAKLDQRALDEHIRDIEGASLPQSVMEARKELAKLPSANRAYMRLAVIPEPSGSGQTFAAIMWILIRLEKVDTDVFISVKMPNIPGECDRATIEAQSTQPRTPVGQMFDWATMIWQTFNVKSVSLFGTQYGNKSYEEL